MNIIACCRRAVEKLITTAAAKEKEVGSKIAEACSVRLMYQDLSKAVIDGPTNGRADWFRRGFPEHRAPCSPGKPIDTSDCQHCVGRMSIIDSDILR
ncbi:Glutathione S-transferase verG [Trichinella spiralis]|uniref:Glutathione S-transferase verG n=1 Tax=Trichinella spiralis TaxID=6334 RepID=A0ABR3KWZ4_TRISP